MQVPDQVLDGLGADRQPHRARADAGRPEFFVAELAVRGAGGVDDQAFGVADVRQVGDDELRAAGVGPGTVRLSVGTESAEDLIWDLEQGFALVAATAGKETATA